MPESPSATVRVVEVLAALSLATDLARGHPPEEAMRACLLALHVGRSLGLAEADLTDACYATLLRYVGCTATSTDYALAFAGDDVDVRRGGDLIDPSVPSEVLGYLWSLTRRAGVTRPLQFARILSHGAAVAQAGAAADCEVGARLVSRFGCSPGVQTALLHSFERWDGRGAPHRIGGEAIPLAARLATLGFVAVMFDAVADRQAATETVRRWSGRVIDPALASVFLEAADDCLGAASHDDPWAAVVAAEPGPPTLASMATIDAIATGFADVADLKSRSFLGHSSGVARLAEAAGRQFGLAGPDVRTLRWAGLVHDIGRVGIATGIWDKGAHLTRSEWEEVRLHPYHTQRIFSRAGVLVEVGQIAA